MFASSEAHRGRLWSAVVAVLVAGAAVLMLPLSHAATSAQAPVDCYSYSDCTNLGCLATTNDQVCCGEHFSPIDLVDCGCSNQ